MGHAGAAVDLSQLKLNIPTAAKTVPVLRWGILGAGNISHDFALALHSTHMDDLNSGERPKYSVSTSVEVDETGGYWGRSHRSQCTNLSSGLVFFSLLLLFFSLACGSRSRPLLRETGIEPGSLRRNSTCPPLIRRTWRSRRILKSVSEAYQKKKLNIKKNC